jgi:myo-inositol-hexaphosphate 3-phosphohydrolase/phosphodiesterase/alkaline phosphatase D-like protein
METFNPIRFATFNASLNRFNAGDLITDLSTSDNAQAQTVAEIIQRSNPDVILINEFDFDENGEAAQLFQENYLSIGQNGAEAIDFPYVYVAPSNTGISSGFDLDNNGEVGGPNDAFGFGFFPGQYGMVVYSKYPINTENVRTFQNFLWKDMPGALLPTDPETGESWYSPEELEVVRLSSKSHWDIPIQINGETLHFLTSHPTPPVFDGAEDRNGTRNHDEIRFWADYVTPGNGDYIYDDGGHFGGLEPGSRFVIAGDQNADPFDGDSTNNAILQLLENPQINSIVTPESEGAIDASNRQGGLNATHIGNPAFDTADFNDAGPGNLRADYVLPSANLEITDAAVFWSPSGDPLFPLVGDFDPNLPPPNFPSSDHRLVWVDVKPIEEIPAGNGDRKTVSGIEFLGEVTFPTGSMFQNTELGGLSSLAYDPTHSVYYAISDDRSQINPARFYTLTLDLEDGTLDEGDITFTDVTTLQDENGNPFPIGSLDPEGLALTPQGTLFISSEGDVNANPQIDPFIREFSLAGESLNALPIPEKYLPTADGSSGIRNNLAFESLTLSPDGRFLYTATENALFQDSPAADLETESLSRILQYDLATGQPGGEFVYNVATVPEVPEPTDAFRTNGLVELLATDNNGSFLALERGFSSGKGNTVKLYEVRTQGALDVSRQDDLFWEDESIPFEIDPAVTKRELLDIEADLGIEPDNLEGLAFGPQLADGRQSLIVVSDNNFSDTQKTQFIALALDFDTTPAVLPVLETANTIDDADATTPLRGDSDDPAIWVHPTDSENSLVLTTLKDGGLTVFDLEGTIQQTVLPAPFGDIRYNNVDLVYGFPVGGETVDLAVVSDRANDTLAILAIDPETRQLSDITANSIPNSIFGVDDGEATAYGLATYTSPVSGKSYAFVTQADGNQVAQLELTDNGDGKVSAEVVRILELPVPTGDPEDSQAESMVIDRELGFLYVAMEDEVGILKFSAEPDGGDNFTVVQPVDRPELEPDLEGLSIYYGANGTGYLLASSQGDSTYAVFSREGTNEYLGSFVISDNGAIDQANESDGLDVLNVPLGSAFPNGLVVVQDGANDPQNAIEDDEQLENNSTNFKFVPWESVANAFPNPLAIDPVSFDPRQPQPQSLVNGIASGDTTQDTTVLWARSTFPGDVTFEYSTDADFNDIAGTATATVTDPTLPVKVEIDNLEAGTDYYYRVTDAAGATAIGRFETAAELGTQNGLNFGVSGDWRGELAPYPAVANVPDAQLAFFVEHGDTIYADDGSPAVLNPDGTFKEQTETLAEFRAKHAEGYGSRFGENFLAQLRASTSVLATIDDHEVTNDFAGGELASSDDRFGETNGLINDTELYENGLQAFQEYNPIRDEFYGETGDDRTADERKLYRFNTYGNDAAVMVLDTRSFRDEALVGADITNPEAVVATIAESLTADRTLLGEAQLTDLKQDLLQSQSDGITWKFVMVPEPIQNIAPGIITDNYDGYMKERTEILRFINENAIDNVVFVAADVHATFVNNLTYLEEPFGEQIPTSAFEITTGAVAYDPPTGAFLGNLFTAGSPEASAFYNALPVAPDLDDLPNDKDDFVKQAFNNTFLNPLGYDPLGLDSNLPQAEGAIDATLLQGDYFVGHSYGWTEFDIDPATQKLTVTTWGIPAYSEAQLLENPAEIANRSLEIVSQFEVNPVSDAVTGTDGDDTLTGTTDKDVIDGKGGNDRLRGDRNDDQLFGGDGNDKISGQGGDDTLLGGNGDDSLYGEAGDDIISGGDGNDFILAWKGNDTVSGGNGNDTFVFSASHGTDIITDFVVGEDRIGLKSGLTFADLSVTTNGTNTEIVRGDETLVILTGVTDSLTAANFVTI